VLRQAEKRCPKFGAEAQRLVGPLMTLAV